MGTMNIMNKDNQIDTWYREPYVWLLITIPLVAVIGGIYTARLAVESNDGMVVDDYYKKGLEINRVLERDEAAEKLGIQANIQLSQEQNAFRLFLTGNAGFTAPDKIDIRFMYATRSGFDKHLSLAKQNNSFYQGRLQQLRRGRWYVQIEAANWRILKSILIR